MDKHPVAQGTRLAPHDRDQVQDFKDVPVAAEVQLVVRNSTMAWMQLATQFSRRSLNPSDLITASTTDESTKTVIEGLVVEGDIDNLGNSVDDSLSREREMISLNAI